MYLYTYDRIGGWKCLSPSLMKQGEEQRYGPLSQKSLTHDFTPPLYPPIYYPIRSFKNGHTASPLAIAMGEKVRNY